MVKKEIYHTGFTLIELAISVAIMGILIGGGMVSYIDFNRRQTLQSAAAQVKSTIRAAQSRAVSGEKPTDGTCSQLLGYKVDVGQSDLTISAKCTNDIIVVDTQTLPAGITFNTTNASMLFKSLGGGVDQSATIQLRGFNRAYELNVSGGDISDHGFIQVQ